MLYEEIVMKIFDIMFFVDECFQDMWNKWNYARIL